MVSSFVILSAIAQVGIIVTILIYTYSAYWAFDIRKALAVRLYRNQALGIGLGSLGFAILNVTYFLGIAHAIALPASLEFLNAIIIAASVLPFILFFFWIDASVLAARRSDPLLRDILGWRRVRIILWSLVIFSITSQSIILTAARQLYQNCIPGCPTDPGLSVNVLFFIPIFIPFVSGAIYLPMSASHSKDRTLRRHFKWFGLFAVCLLAAATYSALISPGPPTSVAFIAGGYCLYRSVRSLVPLNRLSLEARE